MPDIGAQILDSLRTLGITVVASGDRLRLQPASNLPAEMISLIREAKPAILEALRNRPATCSLDCYELEPGFWIHRPWTGCTTGDAEVAQPLRRVAVSCWHRQGERECSCSACWQARPSECAWCKGTGQVWQWVP